MTPGPQLPDDYVFIPADPGQAPGDVKRVLTDEEHSAIEESFAAVAALARAMRDRAPTFTSRSPTRMRLRFGSVDVVVKGRQDEKPGSVELEIVRRDRRDRVAISIPVERWSPRSRDAEVVAAAHVGEMIRRLIESYVQHMSALPTTSRSADMIGLRRAAMAHLVRIVDNGMLPADTPEPTISATVPRDGESGEIIVGFGGRKSGRQRHVEESGTIYLPPVPSMRMIEASQTDYGNGATKSRVGLIRPRVFVRACELPADPIERIALLRIDEFDTFPFRIGSRRR